jgi:hypothetical protein
VGKKKKKKEKEKEEKKRKRKRKKSKNIVKVNVCLYLLYFLNIYFVYDEIVKNKEEFNILIGSRTRITNLYGSCISNIR